MHHLRNFRPYRERKSSAIENEKYGIVFVEDDFFPYAKLLSTQHVDISYRNDSYKEQYNVRFTWSDDFCEENSSVQVIVFP